VQIKWSPCHQGVVLPQVDNGGDAPYILMVIVYMLSNNFLGVVSKGWIRWRGNSLLP